MLLILQCKNKQTNKSILTISQEDYLISNLVSLYPPIDTFTKMKLYLETKETPYVYVKFHDVGKHIICVEVIIYSVYDIQLKTTDINWGGEKSCHFLLFITRCQGARRFKSCVSCSYVVKAIPTCPQI